MNIQRIRFGDDLTLDNIGGFKSGDKIQISEKIDGSNASFRYDIETGTLIAFSRKQTLSFSNTLNGFYNYIQSLNADEYKDTPSYIIFGEWMCLSGDTMIRKVSAGKNTPYMSLRDMYNYLNSPVIDKYHHDPRKGYAQILTIIHDDNKHAFEEICNLYQLDENKKGVEFSVKRGITRMENQGYIYKNDNGEYYLTDDGVNYFENEYMGGKSSYWNRCGMPSIFSLYQDEGVIKANKILNIIYTGDKEVYEVTTRKGYKIKTTLEHRFYTPRGFIPLSELKVKDCVGVSSLTSTNRKSRSYGVGTKQIADMQREHKEKIGKCEMCSATNCLELHHRDGNHHNNTEENYVVLCADCHSKQHSRDKKFTGFVYEYEFDCIESIEYIGIEDCYDISMEGTENEANFVANNFIVHNCKNHICYTEDVYKRWIVYDIYDTEMQQYLPQNEVKQFCDKHNLEYIHVLYYGEFTSWDDLIKKFAEKTSYYCDVKAEGFIVKNQTKLNNTNSRMPFVLKFVNDSYSEIKKDNHIRKIEDPQKLQAKTQAQEIVDKIITKNRIEKEIHKMIDEQILPEKVSPQDMNIIARSLPKRIYDDCMKEEREYVIEAGEFFGKLCGNQCMRFAKEIILGQ